MEVLVNASTPYKIIIGKELLSEITIGIKELSKVQKVMIITDDGVPEWYSKNILNELTDSGYEVYRYIFASGEQSKSIEVWANILEFLANCGFTRTDCLVACGGGIVGDITGFVASSYMRGIKYIQVPTTLLSCIDSSVGGKTAVNLPQGKNLVGSFYQPSKVVCDISMLKTLPKEQFLNGFGEGIKYAIINKNIYDIIKDGVDDNLEKFIYESLLQKKDIVEKDEKEKGLRKILNLGHTFGHAIEKLSSYTVNHGLAVAKGIYICATVSQKLGICNASTLTKVEELLTKFEIDYSCGYSNKEIFELISTDKKAFGDKITLVLIEDIGSVVLKDFEINGLRAVLR